MVKISRQYRSVVKAAVVELQQLIRKNKKILNKIDHTTFYAFVEESRDETDKNELVSRLELWEVVELVWNLCELLYIDAAPG